MTEILHHLLRMPPTLKRGSGVRSLFSGRMQLAEAVQDFVRQPTELLFLNNPRAQGVCAKRGSKRVQGDCAIRGSKRRIERYNAHCIEHYIEHYIEHSLNTTLNSTLNTAKSAQIPALSALLLL